jgi:LmbE family N-acetylglucosaminyl deacetylase
MRTLAIFAHPDDETLGAGGLLTKRDASVAILAVRHLQPSLAKACRVLGISGLRSGEFQDQALDREPFTKLVAFCESAVREFEPHEVVTHWQGDLNLDHVLTARAVLTACRPIPGRPYPKRVLAAEVCSSTEWSVGFHPTVFEDISGVPLQAKLRALCCYGDEIRPAPHARSLEHVRALAAHRGATIGVEHAEAFVVMREIL